ncbi:MAG: hydrogenase maturation nickel metallochaperone HypA [Planctomycetota bacterium]
MHEMSIAMSIVESVEGVLADERDGGEAGRVAAVHVMVGAMSGVVPEALEFAWSAATGGTAVAGARLAIEAVPAAVWCEACGAEREIAGVALLCPTCGLACRELVRGRELEIMSLEMTDEQPA